MGGLYCAVRRAHARRCAEARLEADPVPVECDEGVSGEIVCCQLLTTLV